MEKAKEEMKAGEITLKEAFQPIGLKPSVRDENGKDIIMSNEDTAIILSYLVKIWEKLNQN